MGRAAKSAGRWFLDFLLERWPWILVGATSVIMTLVARMTEFLKPYGAVAWGGVGIVSAVLGAGVFWLGSVAYRSWVLTRFEVRRAEATAINPLAGHFSKRRICLMDFFHPFMQATLAAKFEDCELLGPAVVFLGGCTLLHDDFNNCEAVIAKDNVATIGAMAFKSCIFERCKFFNVTFIMTKNQYLSMKEQAGQGLRVISDGTAGDL